MIVDCEVIERHCLDCNVEHLKTSVLAILLCIVVIFKKKNFTRTNMHLQVCIIGGGASGLYASHYLNQLGIHSHIVLEADRVLGGRLRQNESTNSMKTEIGGEFIHGDSSILNRLIQRLNIPIQFAFDLTKLDDPSQHATLFYHNKKLRDCRDPLWNEMNHILDQIEEYNGGDDDTTDLSIQQFLEKTIPDTQKRIEMSKLIDSYMVKTEGTDLDIMSIVGINEEESTLDNRNYQFVNGYGYRTILNHLSEHLSNRNARLNFVVYKIEWNSKKNLFEINDGTITADHVILTCSIAVLQSNAIEFIPDLPKQKQILINDYFTMRPAMKIVLRFREPFWKKKHSVALVFVSDHPIIAQFWFSHTYDHELKQYIVTGFSTGNKAEYASNNRWTNQMIIDSFKQLLVEIYQQDEVDKLFIGGLVYDWVRDNPFVQGGYSSPKLRTPNLPVIQDPRVSLSEPISFQHTNKTTKQYSQLCIAGEAASAGAYCANVQGALESGEQAVRFILPHLTINHQSKL
jgi:monoamine oxidase